MPGGNQLPQAVPHHGCRHRPNHAGPRRTSSSSESGLACEPQDLGGPSEGLATETETSITASPRATPTVAIRIAGRLTFCPSPSPLYIFFAMNKGKFIYTLLFTLHHLPYSDMPQEPYGVLQEHVQVLSSSAHMQYEPD